MILLFEKLTSISTRFFAPFVILGAITGFYLPVAFIWVLPMIKLLLGIIMLGLGLASGYGVARLLKMKPAQLRALTVEIGMQNSGLAVGLAKEHFDPMAALPGAIFSVWHNISGPLLASFWCRLDQKRSETTMPMNSKAVSKRAS